MTGTLHKIHLADRDNSRSIAHKALAVVAQQECQLRNLQNTGGWVGPEVLSRYVRPMLFDAAIPSFITKKKQKPQNKTPQKHQTKQPNKTQAPFRSAWKSLHSSPLSLSPLVTALSPLAFWSQKCANGPRSPAGFRGRQPAKVVRQPAKLAPLTSPLMRLSLQIRLFSVESRLQMVTLVVRKGCLYYPINFRILVKKPAKTTKFRPKNACHQRCHRFVTAPFLEQKALKTANSEKCVFRVLRRMCCLGLQIRSFSAENRLQVFAVLRNPFSAPKSLRIPARRACHRRSHRSLTRQLPRHTTESASV